MVIVAPHAGARVETLFMCLFYLTVRVAPHAGARVETIPLRLSVQGGKSRPPRGGES